ncbi:hypothetical protein JXA88_19255 [Candidatus Fermentibacteria bacterium]|nr:hypothetical protein [Candidatus Fermentibacteria bacterium]
MRVQLIGVCVVSLIVSSPSVRAQPRDVVLNGSFENGLAWDGLRPQYWTVGFPGEAPIDSLGTWDLDGTAAASGTVSLHLTSHTTEEWYFLAQALDAPTFDLEGKEVSFSLQVKTNDSTGVYALVAAFNPDVPDTGDFGSSVGHVILAPSPSDSGFTRLEGSFVAWDAAAALALVLAVEGNGTEAWFDDVAVIFEPAVPGPGPDWSEVEDPLGGQQRTFHLGTVSELARNLSEAAYEDLPLEVSEAGDMINVFTHIQWNSLRGAPLLEGHDRPLQIASRAEALGLSRMLTFDFTHDDPEGVGYINPMPDGTPVTALTGEVRRAYVDELVALVEAVAPEIVSVGIETNIFQTFCPGQWPDFLLMMQEARAALSVYPDLHVTTYCTLDAVLTLDGRVLSPQESPWLQVLPYCDSVAYSFYPQLADTTVLHIDGYFARPQLAAPGTPLLIPEFGCRSDTAQGFSESLQCRLLSKVVQDVASLEPHTEAVIWFALYDFQYLGAPPWFKENFATLGLRDYAGTPKASHVAFQKMRAHPLGGLGRPPIPEIASIEASPNPCDGACTIRLAAVFPGQRDLHVYDMAGRLHTTVPVPPAHHSVRWTTATMPIGAYLIRSGNGDDTAHALITVIH